MKPQTVTLLGLLLLLLSLVSLASACSQPAAPAATPSSTPPTPLTTKAPAMTPVPNPQSTAMPTLEVGVAPTYLTDGEKISISQQLLTNYLNGFRSPHTPLETRILDFRIDRVRLYRPISTPDDPAKIHAAVVFSVLPAIHVPNRNPWLIGNGRLGDSGWVIEKSQYLRIAQVDDGYSIEYKATAP
jgi:hypothetical protein